MAGSPFDSTLIIPDDPRIVKKQEEEGGLAFGMPLCYNQNIRYA
jgi:hypothetical protein